MMEASYMKGGNNNKFAAAQRRFMAGGVLLLMSVAGLCGGVFSAERSIRSMKAQATEQAAKDAEEGRPQLEPWYDAILRKDAATLRRLLDSGEVGEELYQKVLYECAMLSFPEGVRMMLEIPGIDVNAPGDDTGNSPLMVAMNDEECFRMLLARPEVNVNHVNNGYLRALDWLFMHLHNGKVAQMLLSDPRLDNDYDKEDVLVAVMKNDVAALRRLLQSGRALSTRWQKEANRHLRTAAAMGNAAILRELLALPGLQVFGTYDTDDESPLALAMEHGHDDCVHLLLTYPWSREHRDLEYLGAMLEKAAELRRVDYVEQILKQRQLWYYAQNALFTAAEQGDLPMMRLLLNYPGVNINDYDFNMSSYLHKAAEHGQVAALRLLLSQPGIFLDRVNFDGYTPLQLAMKHGHAECVRLLLAATNGRKIQADMPEVPVLPGALPLEILTAQLTEGRRLTPENRPYKHSALLQAADERGLPKLIKALKKPGTNINERNNHFETALHRSALLGHIPAVALLLKMKGIDINATDESGMTPLLGAALNSCAGAVEHLLQAPGIQVNRTTVYGDTALNYAAIGGDTKVIDMLRKHPQTNPMATDCDDRTALHHAARYDNAAAVRLLLKEVPELDVNAKDCRGQTPLHMAMEYCGLDAAKALLEHPGINANAQDSLGFSPAHYTMRLKEDEVGVNEDPEGIHLLAAYGASLNIRDISGRTPLMLAVQRNAKQIVQALLAEPGVDVNAADKLGRTPLHYLAIEEDTDMLELLLTAPGIHLQARDVYGFTPIDLARNCNNISALTLLHEALHDKSAADNLNR